MIELAKVFVKPNYLDTLRQFEVGETKAIKLEGTAYNSILAVRRRMRLSKEAEFDMKLDSTRTELIVTRIS